MAAAALAWMAGVALQLQQPTLWVWPAYAQMTAVGLLGLAFAWRGGRGDGPGGRKGRGVRLALALLVLCLLGFASTGWRAAQRLGHGLNPALEGADLVLTGRVADMPQVDADGLRFHFQVDRAERMGQAVTVPPRIWLGWGRGWQEDALLAGPPAALKGGELWRLPLRLRRPHGAMNPEGFDAELWLFGAERAGRGLGAADGGPGAAATGRAAMVAWVMAWPRCASNCATVCCWPLARMRGRLACWRRWAWATSRPSTGRGQ
ncbi:MAG: DUF4131 domain-containing protein [Burkholderiales bacterium]|nr:DUF4131 domain-containing protein [Burkholderiales bacterium]